MIGRSTEIQIIADEIQIFGVPACVRFFFYIPTKNLQYILLNYTTYKILYPTTRTKPFGAKNYVYLMATNNRKHEHSTTRYDLKDKESTKITRYY